MTILSSGLEGTFTKLQHFCLLLQQQGFSWALRNLYLTVHFFGRPVWVLVFASRDLLLKCWVPRVQSTLVLCKGKYFGIVLLSLRALHSPQVFRDVFCLHGPRFVFVTHLRTTYVTLLLVQSVQVLGLALASHASVRVHIRVHLVSR